MGQDLLANALIHMHLGRNMPKAPFSIHALALAGRTDVRQWVRPSVAASMLKYGFLSSFLTSHILFRTLASSFPEFSLAAYL
jgi:hypothetical protein